MDKVKYIGVGKVLRERCNMVLRDFHLPYLERLEMDTFEASNITDRTSELYLCLYYLSCIKNEKYKKKMCAVCITASPYQTVKNIHQYYLNTIEK